MSRRTPGSARRWPRSWARPTPTASSTTKSPSNSRRRCSTGCGPRSGASDVPIVRDTSVASAAAAVLAVVVLAVTLAWPSGPVTTTVALVGLPKVQATARLTAEPWGTAMDLHESGQPSGEVLSVSVRTVSGSWWQTGTYRTVGASVRVTMACALKMSKIKSVWVRLSSGQRRHARLLGRHREQRAELNARPGRPDAVTASPTLRAWRLARTASGQRRAPWPACSWPGPTTTGPACMPTTPPGRGARSWPRATGAPPWPTPFGSRGRSISASSSTTSPSTSSGSVPPPWPAPPWSGSTPPGAGPSWPATSASPTAS